LDKSAIIAIAEYLDMYIDTYEYNSTAEFGNIEYTGESL
jgi:hypothetical protein